MMRSYLIKVLITSLLAFHEGLKANLTRPILLGSGVGGGVFFLVCGGVIVFLTSFTPRTSSSVHDLAVVSSFFFAYSTFFFSAVFLSHSSSATVFTPRVVMTFLEPSFLLNFFETLFVASVAKMPAN